MANLWTAGFEVAPDGTTLTSGNTGLTNIYNAESDDGQKYEGTYSCLMALTADNSMATQVVTSRNVTYYGAAFKFAGATSATTAILQANAGTTIQAALRLFTDMTLQLRNGFVEVWNSGTDALSTNTWYWIEHLVNATNSQQRCWVYNSAGSLVIDSGLQTYNKGACDKFNAGIVSNNTVTLRIDRFMGDGGSAIGPLSTAQNFSVTFDEVAGGAETYGRLTGRPVTDTENLDEGDETLNITDTYDEPAGLTDTPLLEQTHRRAVDESAGTTDTPVDNKTQTGTVDVAATAVTATGTVGIPTVDFEIRMDFEGVNGADIGLTDLGFDGGSNDGGTTKFDDTWAETGDTSMRLNILSGGNWHNRYFNFGDAPTGHLQWHYRTTVAPPSATNGTMWLGTRNANKMSGIRVTDGGRFQFQDVYDNFATSTVVIAANTTYRLRFEWDCPNNLAYLHLYYGANLDGYTPDETLTGTIGIWSGETAVSRVQVGAYTTVGATAPSWFYDTLTVTTFGDPGPPTTGTVATPATVQGVALVGEAEPAFPRPYAVKTLTMVMG